MIKEIVDIKRENPTAQRLVIPFARSAEFIEAIKDVQREFNDVGEIGCVEMFMGLDVRLGGGRHLLVQ